ncbi:MAG: SAM-dependent methyltransferase [Candidatus Pacearchaeota archaeon]
MPIYIIEHLEPKLWPWCMIEYKSISKIVGKNNLWFTNIKQSGKQAKELSKYGRVVKKSVSDLDLKNSCVFDPEAKKILTPKEAKSFNYFIFGGILGDYPPRKRTFFELTKKLKSKNNKIATRNIGKKQFSTDNAVYVVKQIINGKNLKDLKFKEKITIKLNKIESVDLPYLYPLIKGKPRVSKELIYYLKHY